MANTAAQQAWEEKQKALLQDFSELIQRGMFMSEPSENAADVTGQSAEVSQSVKDLVTRLISLFEEGLKFNDLRVLQDSLSSSVLDVFAKIADVKQRDALVNEIIRQDNDRIENGSARKKFFDGLFFSMPGSSGRWDEAGYNPTKNRLLRLFLSLCGHENAALLDPSNRYFFPNVLTLGDFNLEKNFASVAFVFDTPAGQRNQPLAYHLLAALPLSVRTKLLGKMIASKKNSTRDFIGWLKPSGFGLLPRLWFALAAKEQQANLERGELLPLLQNIFSPESLCKMRSLGEITAVLKKKDDLLTEDQKKQCLLERRLFSSLMNNEEWGLPDVGFTTPKQSFCRAIFAANSESLLGLFKELGAERTRGILSIINDVLTRDDAAKGSSLNKALEAMKHDQTSAAEGVTFDFEGFTACVEKNIAPEKEAAAQQAAKLVAEAAQKAEAARAAAEAAEEAKAALKLVSEEAARTVAEAQAAANAAAQAAAQHPAAIKAARNTIKQWLFPSLENVVVNKNNLQTRLENAAYTLGKDLFSPVYKVLILHEAAHVARHSLWARIKAFFGWDHSQNFAKSIRSSIVNTFTYYNDVPTTGVDLKKFYGQKALELLKQIKNFVDRNPKSKMAQAMKWLGEDDQFEQCFTSPASADKESAKGATPAPSQEASQEAVVKKVMVWGLNQSTPGSKVTLREKNSSSSQSFFPKAFEKHCQDNSLAEFTGSRLEAVRRALKCN